MGLKLPCTCSFVHLKMHKCTNAQFLAFDGTPSQQRLVLRGGLFRKGVPAGVPHFSTPSRAGRGLLLAAFFHSAVICDFLINAAKEEHKKTAFVFSVLLRLAAPT